MDIGDLPGLQDSKPATLEVVQVAVTASGANASEGSAVAASMLQLPEAFTSSVASLVAEYAKHDVPDDVGADIASGGTTVEEHVEQVYDQLIQDYNSPGYTDDVRDLWTEILELADIDLESAAQMRVDLADELSSQHKRIHTVRVLMDALEEGSKKPTVNQMLLATDPQRDVQAMAAELFPAAVRLVEQMDDALLSEGERRRQRAQKLRDKKVAEEFEGRGFSALDITEQLMMVDDDPDALAALAVNNTNGTTDEDMLFDALEAASDYMTAQWLTGLTNARPKNGQVARYAARLDVQRLRNIGRKVTDLYEEGHNVQVPWMGEIVEHVFVPNFPLVDLVSAVTWHRMKETCGDEAEIWMAYFVELSDPENVLRLQDIR